MLHRLLRDAADRWPDKPAIEMARESVTYAELDRRSDRFATVLIARGCRRGDRVAVLCEKSVEAYVAIWGILKAGCAYVPLDRRAPVSRLGYILANCAVRAIAVTKGTATMAADLLSASGAPEFALSESATAGDVPLPLAGADELAAAGSPGVRPEVVDTDLAYILYTSGSTGVPKGVMISHLNSLSFVRWASDHANLCEGDRVSGHAQLHFDLSIFDIFATARTGGVLVPVPEGVRMFPSRLSEWICNRRINVWYSVPSALTLMAQQENFATQAFGDLRLIIFAGEVFPVKFLNRWRTKLPRVTFMNWYGPTETNVITSYTVSPDREVEEPVPIGRACVNVDVFHVDGSGKRIVAVGEEGELCARGSFVALGYWGDSGKTARSFILDPVLQDRTYLTGDIVSLNDAGEYEYLGRRDHMIKSRGYRIELGEVEAALYRVAGIREAAVVAVPDESYGNLIIAFVCLDNPYSGGDPAQDILAQVAERLPHYMVPAGIRLSEELPKTSSGKIDRQNLEQSLRTANEGEIDGRRQQQDP